MLFRSVSRFVFYTYSFLILLALYVVPSLMFLRALSCFMFNALLFHSVCRSVLNDISGCMQMHGLCYTFRDIAYSWCYSILYVFPCYIYCFIHYAAQSFILLYSLCCSMLYADTCFMLIRCLMQIHALCRSMLYADQCFILLHAVRRSMLYLDPCLIFLPPRLCCLKPRWFMRTSHTSRVALFIAVPCIAADAMLLHQSLFHTLLLHDRHSFVSCSMYTAPCLCSLLQPPLVYSLPPHSSLIHA